MTWRPAIALALILNIHSVGCIGGLLSISAAAASSFTQDSAEEVVMSLAAPEDYLCSNQSLQREDETVKDESESSGCGSSECLQKTQNDRKQQHATFDVPVVKVSFSHKPLYTLSSAIIVSPDSDCQSGPLYFAARDLASSLMKRE